MNDELIAELKTSAAGEVLALMPSHDNGRYRDVLRSDPCA
jgi:hypothetical protein